MASVDYRGRNWIRPLGELRCSSCLWLLEEANGLRLPLAHAFVLFVRAAPVGRSARFLLARFHEIVLEHVRFDFFPADIRQHDSVNLNAWRERLTRFRDHLRIVFLAVDDVDVFILEIVFGHDRANAHAPTAVWFQVCFDFHVIYSVAGSMPNLRPRAVMFNPARQALARIFRPVRTSLGFKRGRL